MRKPMLLAVAAIAASGGAAVAAEGLTLQLKWLPQAQFAGYYVAREKGFYDAAGLEVTIAPGGPDIDPTEVLAAGSADVIVDWMPAALAARERGVPLVNIAQIFDRSGLMLTCRADAGVAAPDDLRGRTLGVWFAGNEYPFLAWMAKLGLSATGADADVTVLRQGEGVEPLLSGEADCVSTMTYNEYGRVLDAGLAPEDLVVFGYEDQGVAALEDGLYTLEDNLADPATVDRLARFVAASIEGWRYALEHREEAVAIILPYDHAGARSAGHQARMLDEVAKLIEGAARGVGYLDPAAYERTVDILLSGASEPVITARPQGAYTHEVWERAGAR